MLLIFGGKEDFNLHPLIRVSIQKKIPILPILLEENKIPAIVWDMDLDQLSINNKIIRPKSILLRSDTFNSVSDANTNYTWFQTIRAWALAHPNVSLFNKKYIGMNKSYNLAMAKQFDLSIPQTIITNKVKVLNQLNNLNSYIVKPVIGGKYTITLADYLTDETLKRGKNNPLFYLQNRLIQPEMRIFGIGEQFFAFSIQSTLLDYRIDEKVQVAQVPVPKHLSSKLQALMKHLQLDFGAADFKACPKTNQLIFLEINSGPMFAKFNQVSNGAICNAMIDWHSNYSAMTNESSSKCLC